MNHAFRLTKKILFIIFFVILLPVIAGAESPSTFQNIQKDKLPVKSLTTEEFQQLTQGSMLMQELDSHKEIRLQADVPEAENITGKFRELKPNFLAEAMFILPVKDDESGAVLEEVVNLLQAVKNFEDIPYYSQYNETWNPLFEDIHIKELPVYNDGSEGIITTQKMRPFKHYTAIYNYKLSGNTFIYTTYNQTPIYYKVMKGVEEEKMYTSLLVKAYPGYLFFYGLGGAKAFDFFGLFGNRLDVAFTGRIEAFFEWFHQEFVQPRLAEFEE